MRQKSLDIKSTYFPHMETAPAASFRFDFRLETQNSLFPQRGKIEGYGWKPDKIEKKSKQFWLSCPFHYISVFSEQDNSIFWTKVGFRVS